MTITVSGLVTVTSDQSFDGSGGASGAYDLTATGDLIIQANVSVQDATPSNTLTGVHTEGATGTPTLQIAASGSLTTTASGSGSTANGQRLLFGPGAGKLHQ